MIPKELNFKTHNTHNTKMKENFKGLISRLDIANARISKPRGRSIEIFQTEPHPTPQKNKNEKNKIQQHSIQEP